MVDKGSCLSAFLAGIVVGSNYGSSRDWNSFKEIIFVLGLTDVLQE